jgi:uncharacterized membrane protein HdeD (DUF308 family)
MLYTEAREAVKEVTNKWWLFLVGGLAWFIVSLLVLRMNLSSVTAVGVLLGVLFVATGLEELLVASVRSTSWAWARVLLAGVFFAGALWCFISPFGAFWSLAAALGLLLVFKGTLDIVESVTTRAINDVWGLGLVAGVLEVLLGFWTSQQFLPAQGSLLLLLVGFYALFRGLSEMALAFQLRAAG